MLKITTLNQRSRRGVCEKGTTLIELAIVIVVLGFTIVSLTKLFMDVSVVSVTPEYHATASMLAHELMEEVKSKRFDELQTKDGNNNWTVPTPSFPVDSGENSGDKTTFDDVDDFDGWIDSLTTPFDGYSASVSVGYVLSTDLNTVVVPDGSPGSTPEYKRVVVTVTHSALVADMTLTTVVGSARSRSTF